MKIALILCLCVNLSVAAVKPAIRSTTATTWGLGFDFSAVTWSIYHVTTLADAGAGSLRDGAGTSNRIIVFDSAGVINLAHNSPLEIASRVIIAGQTAPWPGIEIRGEKLRINSKSDVWVDHVTVNVGDSAYSVSTDNPNERRCLDILSDNGNTSNILISNCTFTGSIDALVRVDRSIDAMDNIAFFRCAFGEPFNISRSNDPQPPAHGMALNVRAGTTVTTGIDSVLIWECLFYGVHDRAPRITAHYATYVNNYGMCTDFRFLNWIKDQGVTTSQFANVVGNVWDFCPESPAITTKQPIEIAVNLNSGSLMYWADNLCPDYLNGTITSSDSCFQNLSGFDPITGTRQPWPIGLEEVAASTINARVLANAGSRPADKSSTVMDWIQRINDSTTARTIDCNSADTIWADFGVAQGPPFSSENIVFIDADAVSEEDDRYNNYAIKTTAGTGHPTQRIISDYSGTTRTATIQGEWGFTPDGTTQVSIGFPCGDNRGNPAAPSRTARILTDPTSPNADADGNGYPDVIDWLEFISTAVELPHWF